MKTILAVIVACLIFAAPLLAEPPKAPEGAQSLAYLTSQAQKIKLGYTKEAEVIQLLGQPAFVNTKTKTRKHEMGVVELKILKYGPKKNLIIFISNGVVTKVDFP
jgi:type II restriction/modification system DNA methylase subunit YeeA